MQQEYKMTVTKSGEAGGPPGTTLSWEMGNEEGLVRWLSEERAPFQTERHGPSHEARGGMGYSGTTNNFPWLELECHARSARELERKKGVSLLSPTVSPGGSLSCGAVFPQLP